MGLTHGSLFTGIGGIDLGLEWAGFETKWQVEINPFCNKVLEKHWPNIQKFQDVKTVGKHNLTPVNLISGGFPCTDLSQAGKKAGLGTPDNPTERSGLWYEYARIIGELRPDWVLIENVPRALSTEGDQILGQMEKENYTSWPIVLGAWGVGASHRRNRAWILCHSNSGDGNGNNLANRWKIFQTKIRALAEAEQEGKRWFDELDAGNGLPEPSTYAGIVRETHGIPGGLDRFKALGNAVVPQIPMLIGKFVQAFEEVSVLANQEIPCINHS